MVEYREVVHAPKQRDERVRVENKLVIKVLISGSSGRSESVQNINRIGKIV